MYFRLRDSIALRSWQFVPRAYYVKNGPYAKGLSQEELDLLLLCDGEHDIEDGELLRELVSRGLIEPCKKGEHPSEWSRHKSYPHRYFPKMNFMITGKCNYNCLHCFNAADNAPVMTEWKYEQALDLLDQARDCGAAHRCLGADYIQPENKRQNGGNRLNLIYVEGLTYADGVFLSANGRRYSVKAGHQRLYCRDPGKRLRAAASQLYNDDILPRSHAEAESPADGYRPQYAGAEYLCVAHNFGKAREHHKSSAARRRKACGNNSRRRRDDRDDKSQRQHKSPGRDSDMYAVYCDSFAADRLGERPAQQPGADKDQPRRAGSGSIVAYCKSCGKKLWVAPDPVKRNGGLTNIFKCTNTKCREYNKEKTNIEVRWP